MVLHRAHTARSTVVVTRPPPPSLYNLSPSPLQQILLSSLSVSSAREPSDAMPVLDENRTSFTCAKTSTLLPLLLPLLLSPLGASGTTTHEPSGGEESE